MKHIASAVQNSRFSFCALLAALLSICASAQPPPQAAAAFDLQEFIDSRIRAGQTHIVIPAGVHRIIPKNQQHLVLRGLNNVQITADNAELICTQTTRALTIADCSNLTIRGLTIDYDPLPFTQGRIVKLSENNTVHDIELFQGYPPADGVRPFKYEIFRPDTRTLRFGSYDISVEKKDAHRIRVIRKGPYQGEQAGDIIAIAAEYAPAGQMPHAVVVTDSQNIVLEDITLYASNCFGFLETRCSKTTYRRCRVERRPAETDIRPREVPRIRSLNADAFHSKYAPIGPQPIDCTAHFQGDDCINICGDYHLVMASEGRRLRVLSKGGCSIQPGDTLEIVTYSGCRLPDAAAAAVEKIGRISDEELEFLSRQKMDQWLKQGADGDIYQVTADRPLHLPRGSIIAAANRLGSGFRITGCDFGRNRSRGILVKASSGIIAGNRICGTWEEAIKVSPEYWWLEAGSSGRITIADNIIQDGQGMGIAVYAHAGSGEIAPAGIHQTIRITGNRISNMRSGHIWVTSTDGLLVEENTIEDDNPSIRIENCRNVRLDCPAVLVHTEEVVQSRPAAEVLPQR